MIDRAIGEVSFKTGLRISPHCPIRSLISDSEGLRKISTQKLSAKGWKRQILGSHDSEFGKFEVEVLSAKDERVHIVLLSHQHKFYEAKTPGDAERRTFHEGIISIDLAGQKEFTWGEVLCRLESSFNKDWLVIAYSREAKLPLMINEVLLGLQTHEDIPDKEI